MGVPSAARLTRVGLTLLTCLVLLLLPAALMVGTPSPLAAQEEAPKAEGEAPAADGTPAEAPAESSNPITFFIRSLGLVFGIIFVIISIALVALIIVLALDLRMSEAVSAGFVDEFTGMVNKRQFKQAYDLAKNDNSYLARVLTAGMARLQYGIEDARESMLAMVDTVKASKETLISYLATIGTLGPLLGLVGTVSGMIGAFRKLGEDKKKAPDTGALAGEISHALVVTLFGVALAVPAIFFYSFFKNRLTVIAMNTSNLADDLLTQMYHNSKKPAGAAAPAGGATAAAIQER